MQTAIRGR